MFSHYSVALKIEVFSTMSTVGCSWYCEVTLVRPGSPHSLSFNRQFNALSFILGEKDEFIITKAKRGGKESFSFFV